MTIQLVRNDTGPVIEFTIKRDGSAVNLTGATVKFYAQNKMSGVKKINGSTCSITDPAEGKCQYNLQAADTSESGDYKGEIEVTFPGGRIETGFEQIDITIRDDIS